MSSRYGRYVVRDLVVGGVDQDAEPRLDGICDVGAEIVDGAADGLTPLRVAPRADHPGDSNDAAA